MLNAVVIGKGMVGNATMRTLGIDKFYSKSESNILEEELFSFKYIFICVPTPILNEKHDISTIKYYVKSISSKQNEDKKSTFIIRSTITPGTCEKLVNWGKANIVHVPEFLTESSSKQDADWPDIIVIGSDNEIAREEVVGIFRARFKGSEFFITNAVTAETIKCTINSFYAIKVVFANQIFDFCRRSKVNYETVKKAMYARKWIGKNHLSVWHKGGRGAGGKCLAKDLDAFANCTNLPMIEYINKLNRGLLATSPKEK